MIAFILHHRNNPSDTGVISMVRHLLKNFHLIADEIARWRDILEVPYQQYLLAIQSDEVSSETITIR